MDADGQGVFITPHGTEMDVRESSGDLSAERFVTLPTEFPSTVSSPCEIAYRQVYGFVTLPPDVTADDIAYLPAAYHLQPPVDQVEGSTGFLLPAAALADNEDVDKTDNVTSAMSPQLYVVTDPSAQLMSGTPVAQYHLADEQRTLLATSYQEVTPLTVSPDDLPASVCANLQPACVGTQLQEADLQPGLVDADLQPALASAQFIEGDVDLSVALAADDTDSNKVFSCLSARVSCALLAAIPGCRAAFLQRTAAECRVSLRSDGDADYVLDGDLPGILRAYTQLGPLVNDLDPGHGQVKGQDVSSQEDKATLCCLLKPQFSRSGRLLKWRTIDDADPPPGGSTGPRRRGRPRRINITPKTEVTVVTPDVEAVKTDGEGVGEGSEGSEGAAEVAEAAGHGGEDEDVKQETGEDGASEDTGVTGVAAPAAVASRTLGRPRPVKDYDHLTPYRYFCDQCSFRTKRSAHLERHVAMHAAGTAAILRCPRCPFTALRASHLRHHVVTHAASVLACSRCRYQTDSHALLVRHTRTKHAPAPPAPAPVLQCPHCDYCTDRPRRLARHARCHAPPPGLEHAPPGSTYQCAQCPYRTEQKHRYACHVASVHSLLRPYLCDHCGHRFKRQDALKQHRTLHQGNGLRPFVCQVCRKTFRSQAHLAEHATRHSDVRAFLCEVCGAAFKTRSVHQKHVRTIHANPRAFPCGECAKRFSTKFALQRHLRMHTQPGRAQGVTAEPPPTTPGAVNQNVQIVMQEPVIPDLQMVSDRGEGVGVGVGVGEGEAALHPPSVTMETDAGVVYGDDDSAYVPTNDSTALLYLTSFPSY